MEAWAKELIRVWEKNREAFAELGYEAIKSNPLLPVKEVTLNDSLQLYDGVTAMMREVLAGSGSDVRDMYFNVVVPGAVAQGQSISGFVAQVTLVATIYSAKMLPQLRKQHREQATLFLAQFWMEFNFHVVKIGMEAGAKS